MGVETELEEVKTEEEGYEVRETGGGKRTSYSPSECRFPETGPREETDYREGVYRCTEEGVKDIRRYVLSVTLFGRDWWDRCER